MLEKHKFESHWSLKARMTWTKKNNEAGKPQEPLGPDSHKGLNQNSNQQPCRLEHFKVATGACRNTECQSAAAFSHLIQNKVVVGICLVKNALSLWDLPSPRPAEPLQCLLSLGAASLHKKQWWSHKQTTKTFVPHSSMQAWTMISSMQPRHQDCQPQSNWHTLHLFPFLHIQPLNSTLV